MMTDALTPALDESGRPLIHSALAPIPRLEGDAFEGLTASIVSFGLMEPGVLDLDGRIVGGRARMDACEIANVKMRWTTLPASESAVNVVIGHDLNRRHLTSGQLGLLANRLMAMQREEAKARQGARHDLDPTSVQNCTDVGGGRASAHAAALVGGISARTVDQVRRVIEQAPDLIPQLESGNLTPDRAERILKKRNPQPPRPVSPAKLVQLAKRLPATLDTLARQLDAALAVDDLPFDFDQWTKMQSDLDPILYQLDVLRDVLASSQPPQQAADPTPEEGVGEQESTGPPVTLSLEEKWKREVSPVYRFGPRDDGRSWRTKLYDLKVNR